MGLLKINPLKDQKQCQNQKTQFDNDFYFK